MMKMDAIVFIHGALGSASEWNGTALWLEDECPVHCLSLPGHDGTTGLDTSMTLSGLLTFFNSYCETHFKNQKILVCGHSLGGYLALFAALKGNPYIAGIITLGTKMHWSPEIAQRENKMLNPALIEEKVPHFAQNLAQNHGANQWKLLVGHISELLTELGNTNPLAPENLAALNIPCRFMLGDSDTMVGLEETLAVHKSVAGSSLSIMPATPHPLLKVNSERLAFEIRDFLSGLKARP